jgi:hypothetical protein
VDIFVSIGGTIVQASLKAITVQRGVFGSMRAAQQPITINISGEENLKVGESFKTQYTLHQFIRKEVMRLRGKEFAELRPEKDTFPTLTFNLRLLMDEGNHQIALLLAAFALIYIHTNELKSRHISSMDNELSTESEQSVYFPWGLWIRESEVWIDPSWREEIGGGAPLLWMQKISHSLLRDPQNVQGILCKTSGSAMDLDVIDTLKSQIKQAGKQDLRSYWDFLHAGSSQSKITLFT